MGVRDAEDTGEGLITSHLQHKGAKGQTLWISIILGVYKNTVGFLAYFTFLYSFEFYIMSWKDTV